MHRESIEKKRRDAFLEKMKELYKGKDGEMIERDLYSTLLAEKIYTLLQFEDTETSEIIVQKLNNLMKSS